jgi:hypothetical protein
MAHQIRHVRYEDFFTLVDDGEPDLEGFRAAVGDLVARMGPLESHHVLIDLRHATAPPLAELLLVEAVAEFARRGLGQANRVAVVFDPGDAARAARLPWGEAVATQMGLDVRAFDDYAEALDWLSS